MMPLPDFRSSCTGCGDTHPVPRQSMLAEPVAQGPWPHALDLPTASGKTACIDVAIHALASQADRWLAERTEPRRVWFVVDRRIADVMDERGSGLDPAHREGGLCWSPGSLCEAPQAFRVSSQGLWSEVEDDIVEHAAR